MARIRSDSRSELDLVAILCLAPSLLYVLAMFVYPFLYGIYISLQPKKRDAGIFSNYVAFFNDAYQYNTIKTTFMLALPTTVAVVLVALFLAYGMRRGIWFERTITTILVLPISLGVVFLSEGILGFYGHNGWLNQLLLAVGLIQNPLELTHNSIGVIFSLFMQNFPFCFLMLLGYISGIDPSLESSARMLGAGPLDHLSARHVPVDRTGPDHRVCPRLRDELCRVSIRGDGWSAGRFDADDLDRGLPAGLRAI
ncbi:ABC-type spermidine/putrescine transport system permease subunit I [Bradyrhizobium japonicum]